MADGGRKAFGVARTDGIVHGMVVAVAVRRAFLAIGAGRSSDERLKSDSSENSENSSGKGFD
jgi:hypothetical protein